MKKLTILPLLFLFVLASSCKKEYITQETVIQNTTVLATIQPNQWAYSSTDGTYNATINMPEIDQTVNDNDGVVVAAKFDGVNYEGLPQVYGGYSYTYYYQPGYLSISVQNADGTAGAAPTEAVDIKIVLVPSAVNG